MTLKHETIKFTCGGHQGIVCVPYLMNIKSIAEGEYLAMAKPTKETSGALPKSTIAKPKATVSAPAGATIAKPKATVSAPAPGKKRKQ